MDSDSMGEMLEDVRRAAAGIDNRQAAAFADALAAADGVFVSGQGRSGLMAAAFATRLTHLGKRAHAVGAPTAPATGSGAVLVACSGSGKTRTTVIHAERAREAGARVWAITQDPSSPLGVAADHVISIPAAPSIQPGRSAFEQALLLFLDAIVLRLMTKLGETPDTMLARHSNLE